MKRLAVLLLGLGAAWAQIAAPLERFSPGPLPEGARIQTEARSGRLYAVRYEGPVNASLMGRILSAATGVPGHAQGFVAWYGKNQALLRRGPVELNVEGAFLLKLAVGAWAEMEVRPLLTEEALFGEDRHVLGEKGVVVRVFSDFQCPYCQRLAREVLPALKAMAREGRLRLAYRHFPLYEIHPEAVPAAVASECAAAQGAFWAYHDLLMAGSGWDYPALARRLGLDPKAFQACPRTPPPGPRWRRTGRWRRGSACPAPPRSSWGPSASRTPLTWSGTGTTWPSPRPFRPPEEVPRGVAGTATPQRPQGPGLPGLPQGRGRLPPPQGERPPRGPPRAGPGGWCGPTWGRSFPSTARPWRSTSST